MLELHRKSWPLPSANTVFTGLGSKFLQASPAGAVPLAPPTAAFPGDALSLSAAGGTGEVTFTASASNSADTKTELLLQPLKSQNRTPAPKGYRTKAFVAFSSTTNTKDVAVAPGFYVPAYRFVNTLTGQDTELITLPVVQVT